MTNGNRLLGRMGAFVIQRAGGANAWLRSVALLGLAAAACGEPAGETSPTETLARSQEAVVDLNAPLAPGEARGARTARFSWNVGHPMTSPSFDLPGQGSMQLVSSFGSGTGALLATSSYPSSGYWIAHKNSTNQAEWVSHLLKAKLPPAAGYDGGALWLTHSLFLPTGVTGPGGVIALDPPGLTNGQGFIQPAPEGGGLLTPVISAPGSGVNGTTWKGLTAPADTGVGVRVVDAQLLRVPVVPNRIVQRSFLMEVKVAVPSHPERAGAVIGNAIRPLMLLQRGGQDLVTAGSGIALQGVDFSAFLNQWVTLQVRSDVTAAGGTAAGSTDDLVRVRYRSYLEGQLIHDEEPTVNASVVQVQTGPISIGPGFALLRGYQGDAPEAFLDELQIFAISSPSVLLPGETLRPVSEWPQTETFGTPADGNAAALTPYGFVAHNGPDRGLRLYAPTGVQSFDTSSIAYKGSAGGETITEHMPNMPPGRDCVAHPAWCAQPGGGTFDGTALWLGHSRFKKTTPRAPAVGSLSPSATGTPYPDETSPARAADIQAYVRPSDARLMTIPFEDGATNHRSYLYSMDVFVPEHNSSNHWLRVPPYVRRGTAVDPTCCATFEIRSGNIANQWFRLDIRADIATYGGATGIADDRAEIYLQFRVNGQQPSTLSGGTYVKLDTLAQQASGPLKFGPSFGILRGWQGDAVEAFFDNVKVQEIVPNVLCDATTTCPSGQTCGANNGHLFGLPAGTRTCWDATCATAATAECGSVQAKCGLCTTGSECTSDNNCAAPLTCREDAGRHYDKPYGADVCAPEICATDPIAGGCGTMASPCGKCEPTPKSCTTNADCPAPEVCGVDNGEPFGLPVDGDYCWAPVCNEPATTPARCGTAASECGICDCSANCVGKACGDDPADGCGGTCDLCTECLTDLDCPSGDSCGLGAGPHFGLPVGTNVCWPLACNDIDPQLPNCGVASDECGACSECVPSCNGRECGSDGCGGTCGSCWAGETCNPAGECVLAADAAYALIHAEDFPEPLADASTAGVGTLYGTFSVSDRGAATYSIPISVPPARAGFQPELGIAYNGSKDEGLLGPGWRVDGFSVIARCPQTVASHGSAQAVSYSTLTFCLDGQALIEQSAPPGSPDRDFRTEVDGFSRIIGRGVTFQSGEGSAAGYTGPEFFEVLTKDGRTMIYGATAGASVVTRGTKRVWALESIRDRAGNKITITYHPHQVVHDINRVITSGQLWSDTGDLRPKSILYGGHENGAPANLWVNFDYEPRPDPVHH